MCIIANLIPYKGHRDLIAAPGLAASKLPAKWRLLVVGRDDGIGGAVKDQAAQQLLIFHSWVHATISPRSWMPATSACCARMKVSNAILEGMASGLPMIVMMLAAMPAVIDNKQVGRTGTRQSASVRGDRRLAADPLHTIFRCGRLRVIEHFGLQPFAHTPLFRACGGKSVSRLRSARQPQRAPKFKHEKFRSMFSYYVAH